MLQLISVQKGYMNDISFDFAFKKQYKTRDIFYYYFHIVDTEKNILYIYTQEDIEKNLYFNGETVKGLIKSSTSNYLVGITDRDNLNIVHNVYLDKLYKVVYGNSIYYGTKVVYNGMYVSRDILVSLSQLYYDWKINYIPYIRNKEIYELNDGNTKEDTYYKEYFVNLDNSNVAISTKVNIINKWRTLNKITTFRQLFRTLDNEDIDITNLNAKDIFDFEEMFAKSEALKTVKLCDFDTTMPIILFNMFRFCYKIRCVDFTAISNDYPDNNFGIEVDITKDKLDLGLIEEYCKSCVFIFNSKTKNFTKQIVDANRLKHLGNFKKGTYNVDAILSKMVLLRKSLEGPYFIIEEP